MCSIQFEIFFGLERWLFSFCEGVGKAIRPGLNIPKKLYSEKTVPHFVPTLHQKP
jgi:hypothetical protein